MSLKPSKDSSDGFNWWCLNGVSNNTQTTLSLKTESLINDFNIESKQLIKFKLIF